MDSISEPFDATLLEGTFAAEMAGRTIELESHQMVFNPTGFGRNLAPLIADRIRPSSDVCEVGIGSGVLCILAGLIGARVTGLDINPHAVHMARRNWRRNQLADSDARFMCSEVFSALASDPGQRFDLIWSNPPLLPRIDSVDQAINDREGFEVAGEHGRQVLDGVLGQAHKWLKPGGRAITIATSLQGWHDTERLLARDWQSYQVLREIELELTDECGPPYIDWWLEQQANDGEERIYQQDGKWMHKLWYLEACK
jgi:methylase of polypeptide subunit release factors